MKKLILTAITTILLVFFSACGGPKVPEYKILETTASKGIKYQAIVEIEKPSGEIPTEEEIVSVVEAIKKTKPNNENFFIFVSLPLSETYDKDTYDKPNQIILFSANKIGDTPVEVSDFKYQIEYKNLTLKDEYKKTLGALSPSEVILLKEGIDLPKGITPFVENENELQYLILDKNSKVIGILYVQSDDKKIIKKISNYIF